MGKIKTKEAIKGTIKQLDRAAIAIVKFHIVDGVHDIFQTISFRIKHSSVKSQGLA